MTLKAEVLGVLEKNRSRVLSGQELANELNVSRTAIWKVIHSLKEQGFNIHSVSNKGYQLDTSCDLLSVPGIQAYLRKEYEKNELVVHSLVGSTNEEAKKLMLSGAKHGTIILAEEQSSGKGRFGRVFYSPPHTGIYMSLILRPKLNLQSAVLLTTAVSVAVCRAIEEVCQQSVQIKWVNDIYLNEKKIGGILTEAVTDFESGTVESVIIGIGLNVSTIDFPEELQSIATSLKPTQGTRNQLAASVINHVLSICENVESEIFMDEYKSRSTVLGKEIYYFRNGIRFEGRALDFNEEGALIVQTHENEVVTLNSGEITIRLIETE